MFHIKTTLDKMAFKNYYIHLSNVDYINTEKPDTLLITFQIFLNFYFMCESTIN